MAQLIRSNPALSRGFKLADSGNDMTYHADTMTLAGAVDKTIISLIALVAAAFVGWKVGLGGASLVAIAIAFVVGLVTSFKPSVAPNTTIPYALLEGFAIGGLSRVYEESYQGIVLTAAGLTFSIFGVLLFLYKTRLIRPSRNLVLAVTAATGGIAVFYLVGLVASLAGHSMPLINSNSGVGILFSVFVVALVSANLVVDFDFIERGAATGAPKYMEWYGAFGLMVTLVWLYLEILRLLAKMRSR